MGKGWQPSLTLEDLQKLAFFWQNPPLRQPTIFKSIQLFSMLARLNLATVYAYDKGLPKIETNIHDFYSRELYRVRLLDRL